MISTAKIRQLVGEITEEQLRFVDSFLGERVGLFIPAVGQCGYAVTENHTHPAYSFVLTFDSNLSLGSSKQTQRALQRGVLIGMSPDFEHHEEPAEDFSRYYAVMIDREFYNSVLRSLNIPEDPQYHFTISSEKQETLIHYLRSFMAETERIDPLNVKIDALEMLIAVSIAESFHRNKNETEPPHQYRIEIDHAVEYIHSAFGQKLTVESIAAESCLSPSHLSHLFREASGKTVMGYLSEVRLQNAKKLLLLGGQSISEIAHICGFSSPSHFASSFKNRYGISPRKIPKTP